MVPNRTCHGDQPCDNGSNADLKCILGPRKTQLEASDMSFPCSRRVKLLVKINTYTSELPQSCTAAIRPILLTSQDAERAQWLSLAKQKLVKTTTTKAVTNSLSSVWFQSPCHNSPLVMSVGSLRSSDSHDSDWFSQGYTKETQRTSLVPTALLMDLCIGSVACVKHCGGNQHKGEPCHP